MAGPTTFTDAPSRLEKLHNFLRKHYEDIPSDFTTFEAQMQDPEVAKSVHDMLMEDAVPVPSDFGKFSSDLGLKKKVGTETSGNGLGAVSPQEVERIANEQNAANPNNITPEEESQVGQQPLPFFPTSTPDPNAITPAEEQQISSPVPGGEPFMQQVQQTISGLNHNPLGDPLEKYKTTAPQTIPEETPKQPPSIQDQFQQQGKNIPIDQLATRLPYFYAEGNNKPQEPYHITPSEYIKVQSAVKHLNDSLALKQVQQDRSSDLENQAMSGDLNVPLAGLEAGAYPVTQAVKGVWQAANDLADISDSKGSFGQRFVKTLKAIGAEDFSAAAVVDPQMAVFNTGIEATGGLMHQDQAAGELFDLITSPADKIKNLIADGKAPEWATNIADFGDFAWQYYLYKKLSHGIENGAKTNYDLANAIQTTPEELEKLYNQLNDHFKIVAQDPEMVKTDPLWNKFAEKEPEKAAAYLKKWGKAGKLEPHQVDETSTEPVSTEPTTPSTEPQPKTPSGSPAPEETVSVPIQITNKMKGQLTDMGYTDEDINAMKPQEAHDVIDKNIAKPKVETNAKPEANTPEPTGEQGSVKKEGAGVIPEATAPEEVKPMEPTAEEKAADQKLKDLMEKKKAEKTVETPVIPEQKHEIDMEQAPVKVPIADINIDKKRFQNRASDFAEKTAKSVAEDFKPHKMSPVVLWEDPNDKKTYLLAGHSRLEGFKRRGEATIPSIYAKGLTEAEAIHFATVESNTAATPEKVTERAGIYIKKRQAGESHASIDKEIQKNEKSNVSKITNFSYLDPNGKAFKLLETLQNAENPDNRQNTEKLAEWTGKLRRQYRHLTNKHEGEIFDHLLADGNKYPSYKELEEKLKNDIGAVAFDPQSPLNITRKDFRSPLEVEYEKNVKELNTQITRAQTKLEEARKEKLLEGLSGEELDKTLKPHMDELTYLQKEMLTLKQSKGLVQQVAKQPTLFENPFTKEEEKQFKQQTAALGEEITVKDFQENEQDIQQSETPESDTDLEKPVQEGIREASGGNGVTGKTAPNKRTQKPAEHPTGAEQQPRPRNLTAKIITDELVKKGLISGNFADNAIDYLNGDHNAITEQFYNEVKDIFEKEEAAKNESKAEPKSKEEPVKEKTNREKAKERMDDAAREALNSLNSGLNAKLLEAMLEYGYYVIKDGIHDFAEWSQEILKDYGEKIRPYLEAAWNSRVSRSLEADRPTLQEYANKLKKEKEPITVTGEHSEEVSKKELKKVIAKAGLSEPDLSSPMRSLDKIFDFKPEIEMGSGRMSANKQAEEILRQVESGEKTELTGDDLRVLAQYSGRGNLPDYGDKASDFEHFTPPTTIENIYKLLTNAATEGVWGKSRSILEPAGGTLNFFGLLPDNILSKVSTGETKLTAVDLPESDALKMARLLYPQVSFFTHYEDTFKGLTIPGIKGYVESLKGKTPHDLIVTNVPFDANTVMNGHLLHDGFILECLKALQEGGVFIGITSTGTMDKMDAAARREMLNSSDFMGAVRLAPGTFKKIASTDVSSDVIFLRKRSDKDFIISNSVAQFTGPEQSITKATEVDAEISGEQLAKSLNHKSLEGKIRKLADQHGVDFKTAFMYAKNALFTADRNTDFQVSMKRLIEIGNTSEGKAFIKSAQGRIRTTVENITDPVIRQGFTDAVKQAFDAHSYYGGLGYMFQKNILPELMRQIDSKVTDTFPKENVIQGNQLYSLVFNEKGDTQYKWEENLFSIIKADSPDAKLPTISLPVNNWHYGKTNKSNLDVQYTRWGPKAVIQNSSFGEAEKEFINAMNGKPATSYSDSSAALRIGDNAFFPQDGNPQGSLIVLDDGVFRKDKLSERHLEAIALTKIKEKFGEEAAKKSGAYNKGFTLRSLFGESEVKNSKEKRATREIINVPDYLKKNYLELAKAAVGLDASKQADFIKIMGEVYNMAKYSMYNDISDKIKKAGDFELVMERLKQYDNILKIQHDTNTDPVNQDRNRAALRLAVSDFLSKNDLQKFGDDKVVSKYLLGEGGNKSDNRYYMLKALDNLISDYKGNLKPIDKWGGIFSEPVNFSNTHVVNAPGDLVDLMSSVKSEFTTHINVENLLDYVKTNQDDYSKVPSLGEDLSEMVHSENAIRDLVDSITKDGVFMVDYNNKDALTLIRIEDYAIGNINNNINAIERHQETDGIDTPWHNTEIALSQLRELKNTIPTIPLDSIQFSHNQQAVSFRDNALPFMERMLGRELNPNSYYFDSTANDAQGAYKFNALGTKNNIAGHNLSNQALTEGMLVRWFNNEYEYSEKRDITGKPILNDKDEKIMIPDLDLTNERNTYIQKEMNTFFKDELPDNAKSELHNRYNNQYGVYNKPEKFDDVVLDGLTKDFHGAPLFLDKWQKRAYHKAMAQLYGYTNHAVGAGKTITHALIAVGLKQTGAANKIPIVVPNKAFKQWLNEFKNLFPDLQVKTISTKTKREDIADVAVNNYPVVLIPASTFNDTMQLSSAKQIEYIEKDLQPFYELRTSLQNEIESESDKAKKKKLQSQLNKILKVIDKSVKQADELRARRLTDTSNMSADRMGFNALLLDEAHHYKNVATAMTGFENVSGIGSGTSDKAQMMRYFTQYIQENNHGRNVFYFTGTPVTNSATEIYQVLKAVAPKLLEDSGIRTFNDFVAAHGDIRPEETVRVNGEIKAIDTFKGLTNPNSLKRLINNVFDVLSQEKMNSIFKEKGKPIPEREAKNNVLPATPEKRIMGYYVIHMSSILAELAKDKEGMKERRDERKRLLIDIRNMKEGIKNLEKTGITADDAQKLEEYKRTLKKIESNAKSLGMNMLSLYTNVKGGIVHTKLFHPLIDDSTRSDAKINAVAQEAAKEFIADHLKDMPKTTIDGREYYITGQDEDGRDKLRSVKNGQLFFSDSARRSDLPGFNAQDAYIDAIKSLLPDTIKDKDKLFMKLDSDAQKVLNPNQIDTLLAKYFKKDSQETKDAIDTFNNLEERRETQPVLELNDETGEYEQKIDEDGNPVTEEIVIPAGRPTNRDVAQYLYNKGEVQFLFGSTKSMGDAMNLQYTTTKIDHIDYPFKPAEYIQQDGRSIRQGNLNHTVTVNNWASEGGSEVLLLQLLHTKQGFIEQVWNLDKLDEFADEDNGTLQTGETDEKSFLLNQIEQMIAGTHDHRIREYTDDLKKRDKLLNRLSLYRGFLSANQSNENRLTNLADEINKFQDRIKMLKSEDVLPKIISLIDKQTVLDEDFKEKYQAIEQNPEFMAARDKAIEKFNAFRKKIMDEPAPTTEAETEAQADRIAQLAELQKRDIDELRRDKRWYPTRKYVEDYTIPEKLNLIEKLQKSGDKRYFDLIETFFKKDALIDKKLIGDANMNSGLYQSEGIVNALKAFGNRIPDQYVKKLTTKGNYANMTLAIRNDYYTLNMVEGILNRAVMSTETSISNYSNERMKLQETMNSDNYQRTLQDADDNVNGSLNIQGQIEDIVRKIQENAGVFDKFIQRQKSIAAAAGNLVDNVFPGLTPEQRLKAADTFIENIGKFERGEIEGMPNVEPEPPTAGPSGSPSPKVDLFSSIQTNSSFSSMGTQIAPVVGKPTGKEFKLRGKNKFIAASDVARNMVNNLDKAIGAEVRAGFRGARMQRAKGLQGFYLKNNGIIRIKHSLSDFSTFAHEIGHALDIGDLGLSETLNVENPTPDQIVMKHELLTSDLPRISGIAKYMNASEEVRVKEAVAEFIRKYIMSPEQALKECPRFHEFFEQVIESAGANGNFNIGVALKTARNDWATFESQDELGKVMSLMAKEKDGGIKTFIQGFWENPRRFIKKWVNYYELAIFDDRYVERNLLRSYFYELQKSLTPDEKSELDSLQKNIRYTINLINGNGGQIKAFIEHHPFTITSDSGLLNDPSVRVEWSNTPSLFQIEKPFLDEGKINELEAYLFAKRILWYHELGKLMDNGSLANDKSISDYKKVVDRVENEFGKARMDKVVSDLQGHNSWLFKYLKDSGRYTEDEVQAMTGSHPVYVPMLSERSADEGQSAQLPTTGDGGLKPTNPVRDISPLDLKDLDQMDKPLDALITNAMSLIKMGNENRHLWSLVKFLHEIGEGVIQRIPDKTPIIQHYDEFGEPVFRMASKDPAKEGMCIIRVFNPKEAYDIAGQLIQNGGIKQLEFEDDGTRRYETEEEGVFNKTIPQYYQIPEDLYNYLTYKDKFQKFGNAINQTPIGKILGGMNSVLRNGAVNLNISWVINNMFRDYGGATFRSENLHTPGDIGTVFPDLMKELMTGKLSADQWLALASGADMRGLFDIQGERKSNFNRIHQNKVIGLINKSFNVFSEEHFLRRLGQMSEQLNRYSAFKKSLSLGKTVTEAANEQRNITADFSIAGAWSRLFNKVFYFLTANLAWTHLERDVIGKFMRGEKVDRKRIAMVLGAWMGVELLFWWLNNYTPWTNDPEEKRKHKVAYYNMPSWKRNGFYLIPTGNTTFVPVPKGFFQILFGGILRQGLERSQELDRDKAADYLNTTSANYFYANPMDVKGMVGIMIPGQIRPLIEQIPKEGYSFYKQKNMVPPNLENEIPERQFFPWTPNIYKSIGKHTGLSPIKLENLAEEYGANITKFGAKIASEVTSGHVSSQSTSFMDDMGSTFLPTQFDKSIEYLANRSQSGQEFLQFDKDMLIKDNSFKKMHQDWGEAVLKGDEETAKVLLKDMERLGNDPDFKLYGLQSNNDSKLKLWKGYISNVGHVAQRLSQSSNPDDQKRGKQLEIYVTDAVTQLMQAIDRKQDLPSSPKDFSPDTIKMP